jgi:hypothetical protein
VTGNDLDVDRRAGRGPAPGVGHVGARPPPQHNDYESFADFRDPDGNTWIMQERGDGG